MRALADPARAAAVARFFRTGRGEYGEGDRFLGIAVPVLRRFARAHEGLALAGAQTLLRSPWHEERLLALLFLVRQYAKADAAGRRAVHRLYLRNTDWVNNWDPVDCSAEYLVGADLGDGDRGLLARLRARYLAVRSSRAA